MSTLLWGSVLCCGGSEEGASGADGGLEELPGRGKALRRGSHAHEEGVIKGWASDVSGGEWRSEHCVGLSSCLLGFLLLSCWCGVSPAALKADSGQPARVLSPPPATAGVAGNVDSTAHDGITQVEWRHSKGGGPRMLEENGMHDKQTPTKGWAFFGLFLSYIIFFGRDYHQKLKIKVKSQQIKPWLNFSKSM